MGEHKYNVASVERAIAIIDCIAHSSGMTFREICEETGFAKASVYTLLQTCLFNELLVLDEGKRYHLGTKLLYWGHLTEQNSDLGSAAIDRHMSALAAELEVSVHLGQMIDGRAVFVKKRDGNLYTIKTTVVGQEALFHCQCTAKILLAYQPEDIREQILKSIDYPAFTENTITDPQQLRAQLEQIRTDGFAFDMHERSENIIGVGVPVFNWDGRIVAAVSIGYIGSDLPEEKKALFIRKLRQTSRLITASVGNKQNF